MHLRCRDQLVALLGGDVYKADCFASLSQHKRKVCLAKVGNGSDIIAAPVVDGGLFDSVKLPSLSIDQVVSTCVIVGGHDLVFGELDGLKDLSPRQEIEVCTALSVLNQLESLASLAPLHEK